jgi:hypothetical protein
MAVRGSNEEYAFSILVIWSLGKVAKVWNAAGDIRLGQVKGFVGIGSAWARVCVTSMPRGSAVCTRQ